MFILIFFCIPFSSARPTLHRKNYILVNDSVLLCPCNFHCKDLRQSCINSLVFFSSSSFFCSACFSYFLYIPLDLKCSFLLFPCPLLSQEINFLVFKNSALIKSQSTSNRIFSADRSLFWTVTFRNFPFFYF